MAAFKFRLEPILKLRKLRQEQQERKVAQRVALLVRARDQLAAVDQQIEQHYESIRQTDLVGTLSPDRLIGDRRYLNHLHVVRHTEMQSLAGAQKLVDEAKLELAEAKKQTDIMEKLKERTRERFMAELRRKETLALDDVATSKYAWRRQMGDEDTDA
ncbi:MAG: flagellar export protein FliJ [Phycisphaerae bacterium]|nr:flagellar export protein FliJ [Phycisphaerae bacterium]